MPRAKGSRLTVKDLARDLGMSVSTVSRAFYPDAAIAEATRQTVLKRASEIGYRPNPFAKSLITKKTQIVGMVVSDLTNPFYPEVMTRLTSLLQKQIKYGLTDRAAIAFHEAGFADRYVASTLGLVWGDVVDRDGVRAACQQEEIVRAVLAHIPSYFVGVAAELGGWA